MIPSQATLRRAILMELYGSKDHEQSPELIYDSLVEYFSELEDEDFQPYYNSKNKFDNYIQVARKNLVTRGLIFSAKQNKHDQWKLTKSGIEIGRKLFVEAYNEDPWLGITNRAKAFLFAWNPEKWKWTDILKNIEEINNCGSVTLMWTCASYKSCKINDRAFLIKLGNQGHKGIFASGVVISEPFLAQHWNGEEKDIYHVYIEFDTIIDPEKSKILDLNILKSLISDRQDWTPRASGISIQDDVIDKLESAWFEIINKESDQNHESGDTTNSSNNFIEGRMTKFLQTKFERSPEARKLCLEHYGYSCSVCELNFEKRYGSIGKYFIHVHHLNPISTIGKVYKINPIEDLRPVCPNCHAMIHTKTPPYSLDEMKLLLIL